MTRQKKEIIKRIDYLNEMIYVDMELGCGFAPEDAYLPTYEEIDRLLDELAHLRGYKDHMEMAYDERGQKAFCDDPNIPFH